MQTTLFNKNYKFIPSNVVSFDTIYRSKHILTNDIYEKYEAVASIKGELIICNDAEKMTNHTSRVVYENYQDYISNLEKIDPAKDKWIYNIIDGISEQKYILYRDDRCIIIPSYKWDASDITKLHILCLPVDKNLRTIRSLDASHIPLLEHMKQRTLYIIKHGYRLDESHIKMYFHYDPSTYHLHIHFVNLQVNEGSSVEYSHDLDYVINNLTICSDYYKIFSIKRRI
jgi:diadenosine tetraphosphate (Ap4A) HIT family hydrolase